MLVWVQTLSKQHLLTSSCRARGLGVWAPGGFRWAGLTHVSVVGSQEGWGLAG